jgi:hypothetical protein
VASALLSRVYPCRASADLRRSSASVGATPFGDSTVIFPRTCSGSNRNVIPVSAATCLTTVWTSTFSKEMGREGGRGWASARREEDAEDDTGRQHRALKGQDHLRSHHPNLLYVPLQTNSRVGTVIEPDERPFPALSSDSWLTATPRTVRLRDPPGALIRLEHHP